MKFEPMYQFTDKRPLIVHPFTEYLPPTTEGWSIRDIEVIPMLFDKDGATAGLHDDGTCDFWDVCAMIENEDEETVDCDDIVSVKSEYHATAVTIAEAIALMYGVEYNDMSDIF